MLFGGQNGTGTDSVVFPYYCQTICFETLKKGKVIGFKPQIDRISLVEMALEKRAGNTFCKCILLRVQMHYPFHNFTSTN